MFIENIFTINFVLSLITLYMYITSYLFDEFQKPNVKTAIIIFLFTFIFSFPVSIFIAICIYPNIKN